MNQTVCRLLCILLSTAGLFPCHAQSVSSAGWDQFKHPVPAWFQDAKFGIYFHWGVYTVPAYNSEWYSRTMYVPGTAPYTHHQQTYGPVSRFGYKDFIPLFTAARFNADEWASLFVRAGARFAGPVAEHADGFSMWHSRVNRWNAGDMGPGRDVVGEMEKAVRKRNLKFIATFHHQWQWGWYPASDTSADAGRPEYRDLYGPAVRDSVWMQKEGKERPDSAFCARWLAKVMEVVTGYHPDLLYFDSRLGYIEEAYRKEMVAAQLGGAGGASRLVLHKGADLPTGIGVRTYEKVRQNRIGALPWLMEEPISTYSWSYTAGMQLRTAPDILHSLIDVVSKNGVYLLNICPKSDGTIPQEQQAILLSVGSWLQRHSEAIYDTRPWYTWGEGPRKEAEQRGETIPRNRFFDLHFTAADIRYTTKSAAIYALILGQPAPGKNLLLTAFNKDSVPQAVRIKKIALLGSAEKIRWVYQPAGLLVTIPARLAGTMAAVLKIETE